MDRLDLPYKVSNLLYMRSGLSHMNRLILVKENASCRLPFIKLVLVLGPNLF